MTRNSNDMRGRPRRARRRWLYNEPLEQRVMLDGHPIVWGVDAGLSLSFVADGTSVGPETSSLFGMLDRLAPTEVWQEAILRGFQTWAQHTNADIAVVADDGSDLGVSGATTGDPRFGDIRVAAIPMAADYFATSIPTNELVDGTWVGDVFINSNASIESVDDLFAIALHEAGHVFGLDHSDDPASPLYRHQLPASTVPTADDIAALQRNFGVRRPDSDGSSGKITQVELKEEGTAAIPGIVFGAIDAPTEVDAFEVKFPERGATGNPLSIRLVTDGISLLRGRLRVETRGGVALGEANYHSTPGQSQVITLVAQPESEDELIVRVAADGLAPYDVGGYSLVVTYDDSNIVSDEVIDRIAKSRVRSIAQDDIQRFFEMEFGDDGNNDDDDADEVLLDEDGGQDDEVGREIELREDGSFPDGKRFVTMNALSSATDVDRYKIQVPANQDPGVVTVSLSSLTPGFRASVIVRDRDGHEVNMERLINGEGSSVAQLRGVDAGRVLTFEIRAHAGSRLAVGNYELLVRLDQTAASPNLVASGNVGLTNNRQDHHLRVYRTQLFQFGVEADPLASADIRPTAQVLDTSGKLIHEIVSVAGELSTATVLLSPGDYTITISDAMNQELVYRLFANAVDQPLGPEPIDPTEDPFLGYEFFDLISSILMLGDINGDGLVTFEDFLRLSNNFGKPAATRLEGDLNGDLMVDFADFLILSENFGQRNAEAVGLTP